MLFLFYEDVGVVFEDGLHRLNTRKPATRHSIWSAKNPQRSTDVSTDLVLERGVRHAVHHTIQARLALPEQRWAEHDRKVLHGHLVLRLVLHHSIRVGEEGVG